MKSISYIVVLLEVFIVCAFDGSRTQERKTYSHTEAKSQVLACLVFPRSADGVKSGSAPVIFMEDFGDHVKVGEDERAVFEPGIIKTLRLETGSEANPLFLPWEDQGHSLGSLLSYPIRVFSIELKPMVKLGVLKLLLRHFCGCFHMVWKECGGAIPGDGVPTPCGVQLSQARGP